MAPRKLTAFPLFSSLPKEIQLSTIGFALQIVGELISVQRAPKSQTARERGLWAPPHRFLSVSRIFREETQRLRPRAFAMVENAEAERSSDGNDYCTSADRFPLSHDLLVLPQQTFDIGVESNFNLWRRVSDLQKLETVVISGTAGFYYSAALTVAANACVVQSIKMVVLIRQSDLDLSLELSRYTTVGPHFEGDLVVRDVFKVSIKRYRELHGLAEVLKVVLLRLVRKCEEGEHLPRVLEGGI